MKKVAEFRRGDEQDKDPYQFTECGLDDVYLRSGYEMSQDGTVRIRDGRELLKAIGLHLVTRKKTLSPKELRFLRREMDETQADLADELGVSDQTVARWEKGQVELPGPADYLIRLLYLECIGVTKGVRSLLETLRNTDEPVNGRVVFTKDGKWRLAKCA